MNTWTGNLVKPGAAHPGLGARTTPVRPSYLHLVSPHDLQALAVAVAGGELPADFEKKLQSLATADLGRCFIAQNCRTMIALLRAAGDGSYQQATRQDCERLLRVLAYVRKDEDAIPDYRIDGFADDQQEVRAAVTELGGLLQGFKAWRLCHQVPALWSLQTMHPGRAAASGRCFRTKIHPPLFRRLEA